MAATMMSKAFAGTSLRQAVPTAGKVRQSSASDASSSLCHKQDYLRICTLDVPSRMLVCFHAKEALAVSHAPLSDGPHTLAHPRAKVLATFFRCGNTLRHMVQYILQTPHC